MSTGDITAIIAAVAAGVVAVGGIVTKFMMDRHKLQVEEAKTLADILLGRLDKVENNHKECEEHTRKCLDDHAKSQFRIGLLEGKLGDVAKAVVENKSQIAEVVKTVSNGGS